MHRILPTIMLLLSLSFSFVKAGTHPCKTHHFSNQQLVTTTLTDFSKDDDGFLWIGTETGLLRFDGNNFDSFFYDDTNPNSLSDNRINKLLCDRHSRLWVATCEGLNLYDPDSDGFIRISLPGIEFNGYISDICECSDGSVAFIAAGIGVYKISSTDSTPTAIKIDTPEATRVNSVIESSSHKLVCGTHDGELITVDVNGNTTRNKITGSYIRFLISDHSGDILAFCSDSIVKWSDTGGVKARIHNEQEFTAATLSKDGNIIAASKKRGLFSFAKGNMTPQPARGFKLPANKRDASISALYEDAEQNLWIGIPRYGALMAAAGVPDHEQIGIAEIVDNFSSSPVLTIADGETLWCGLSDGRLLNINLSGELLSCHRFSNAISSLHLSDNGELLAGVDNEGLYEINAARPHKKLLFRPAGQFQGSSIACDSRGTIYFGLLGGGVTAVNPGSRDNGMLPLAPNLIWVSSLFCDSGDRLWIGMYGSLVVFDTKTKETIYLSHQHPQLCKGVHNSIREDSKGQIWSVTSNGLFIINPRDWTYRYLSVKDGLPDMYLSSIAFDGRNNAWIGCHEDVAVIDSCLHVSTHRIGDDFGFSCISLNRGRIIFGGNKGVTIFQPSRFNAPQPPDKPFVSGLFIDGTRITKNLSGSDGEPYLREFGNVSLCHDNGNLTIRLADKDFTRNVNRTYMWRIPGMYDSWTQLPYGISSLTLPHLPPGKYTIQVKAKEDELESEQLEVPVTVTAPWYLTLTAKILFTILLLAIPALIWLYYAEKKRQRIKQEKIKYIVDTTRDIWQPVMKGNDEKLIKRISDTVNGNLHDSSFNVEKLGEEVGLSRAHLNRKMKELFGMNPSEFLRNARMKQACELLKNEDLDISQVAFRVGFCTQAHFANSFKRFSGMPPSDYRMVQKGK